MSRGRNTGYPKRLWLVGLAFAVAIVGFTWRLLELQVLDRDFFREEGKAQHLRTVEVPAHRGMITDRHGRPLAVSTPVASVWFDPEQLRQAKQRWPALASAVGVSTAYLRARVEAAGHSEFYYLRRQVRPEIAQRVRALDIPGVNLQTEYQRYYPAGAVAVHVVGFTNIDGRGLEGLELAFDEVLRSVPGKKLVIQDNLGRIIRNVKMLKVPQPGQDIRLSIDLRLQYIAYRELREAVREYDARAGSMVILDVHTGEILAMVNQPSCNPNDRSQLQAYLYRNRAVTDTFEPGSSSKPFTIAAALESGKYQPHTPIHTGPGYIRIGGYTIHDTHNYGLIDVSLVIKKSSNVGASQIALGLDPERQWQAYARVGFGTSTASGFPGEASGQLPNPFTFSESKIARASLAFGYGISVTALQLVRAYAAFGTGGILKPVTFLYREHAPEGQRVWSEQTASAVLSMLEGVVSEGGTGERARVPNYSVAGKTGTVHVAVPGGYSEDRYIAVWVGLIPASDPQLAAAVVVYEPQGPIYWGGAVAAPVFSQVMREAVRLLNIPPDNLHPLRLVSGRKQSG